MDPRTPVVCCTDPACGRELTRPERHAWREQDGRCDECFLAAHAEPTQIGTPAAAAQGCRIRFALKASQQRMAAIGLGRTRAA